MSMCTISLFAQHNRKSSIDVSTSILPSVLQLYCNSIMLCKSCTLSDFTQAYIYIYISRFA